MDTPADWISESELAAATGVAEEDRPKFHRNLLNWRHNGLLPETYDGVVVPQVRPLGVGSGPGNEAVYPPIVLQMVRRINELRQGAHDMDGWLWQLWLERHPIDIIKWCRERLRKLDGAIGDDDQKRLIEIATRKPAKRSDARRTFYSRLKTKGWFALMTWAVNVAIGRLAQSMFDPASPPRTALATLVAPLANPSSIRDNLAGAGIEDMRLGRLLAILNQADAVAIERARKDCLAWSRAGERRDSVGFVLSAIWRKLDVRALILPGLIALRRSPDHQGSLAEALGLSEHIQ